MSPASRPARRRLELMRLNEIEPARRNPKRHVVDGIAGSIDRLGMIDLMTLDERTGRLVSGHGRLESLEQLAAGGAAPPDGIEIDTDGHWLVPVVRGWRSDDDDHAEAAIVGLNQWTILGGFDEAQLAAMLTDSAAADILDLTGFKPVDLDEMLDRVAAATPPPPTLNEPDDAPSLPTKAHTKTGQLWQLGPHLLLVGDARSAGDIAKVMGDQRADMVWTDPPYGVDYVGKTSDKLTIQGDRATPDALEADLKQAFTAAFAVTRPGGAWYVTGPAGPLSMITGGLLADLRIWRSTIIWVKDSFVLGRGDYHYRHEPMFTGTTPDAEDADLDPEQVFYGWRAGAAHRPLRDRRQSSVWEIPRPKASREHPTIKPVALVQKALENSGRRGAIVLDPYAGAGTTLIAAHATGMIARLVEKDPRYADVICRRYQEHTGTKPIGPNGKAHNFSTDG